MYVTYRKKKQINKDSFNPNLELTLILYNTQYARNVAEIFQIAKAFRIKECIICGDSAKPPFGKDLSKASQSEEFHVNWSESNDIFKTLEDLKRKSFKLIAIDSGDESKSIFDTNIPYKKIALLIGNESTGLSREIVAKLDNTFYIPNYLNSGMLSSNLATAIMLSMIFIKTK